MIESLLDLIEKDISLVLEKEQMKKFVKLISFLKNTEILSEFSFKYIKLKLETKEKLSLDKDSFYLI
jgi:hypothetical protein